MVHLKNHEWQKKNRMAVGNGQWSWRVSTFYAVGKFYCHPNWPYAWPGTAHGYFISLHNSRSLGQFREKCTRICTLLLYSLNYSFKHDLLVPFSFLVLQSIKSINQNNIFNQLSNNCNGSVSARLYCTFPSPVALTARDTEFPDGWPGSGCSLETW